MKNRSVLEKNLSVHFGECSKLLLFTVGLFNFYFDNLEANQHLFSFLGGEGICIRTKQLNSSRR